MNDNTNITSETVDDDYLFYWQEMGLSKDLFEHDVADLFYNAQWTNYLELIEHLSQYCRAIKVLVGENKVGKSTFLSSFEDRVNQKLKVVRLEADESWSVDSFVEQVIESLQLNLLLSGSQNKPASVVDFLQKNNNKYVVIIDDAHKLSDEVLLSIKEWNDVVSPEKPNLHFLLSGENVLCSRLKSLFSPDDFQEFVRVFELKPLNSNQIEDYLKHCLIAAEFTGTDVFDKRDIKKIHKESQGYFSDIDQAAKLILIDKMMPNSSGVLARLKEKKSLILIVFVVLITLWIFKKKEPENLNVIPSNMNIAVENEEEHLDQTASKETDLKNNESISFDKANMTEQSIPISSQESIKDKETLVTQKRNDSNENFAEDEELLADHLDESDIALQKEIKEINELLLESEAEDIRAAEKELGLDDSSKPKELQKISEPVTSNLPDQSILEIKSSENKKIVENKSPKSIDTQKLKKVTVLPERKVVEKRNKPFAIQLAALKDLKMAREFAKRNKIEKDMVCFRVTDKNKNKLIAVTIGGYSTRNEAKVALSKLSNGLKKHAPWIRQVKGMEKVAVVNNRNHS